MDNSKKDILVVIGNGFDLAYGLKSSYKHFFNSNYWPFQPPKRRHDSGSRTSSSFLERFLNERMEENWYNLESLLAEYGELLCKAKEDSIAGQIDVYDEKVRLEADEKSFNKLKKGLKDFITDAANVKTPDPTNPAARFLIAIIQKRNPIIYSFNYTNLSAYANACAGVPFLDYTHVHGSLKGPEEIVLGVQDNTRLPDGYDFLRKVSEPTYRSTNLFFDLMRAKEVVFFGHSLGENDYHFFRSFFLKHSDENRKNLGMIPHITFFTANAKSRIDILKNLREMNNGKNDQLFALNDLRFIRTADNDPQALKEFDKWIMELDENDNNSFD